EAKRSVSQPTLFYMPHCSKLLYNNVLWANWGPSLKNVVIFGNGFSSYEHSCCCDVVMMMCDDDVLMMMC
ncbi:hypothetical protein QZH41_015210, partial [Actinostola sp. cb2023]